MKYYLTACAAALVGTQAAAVTQGFTSEAAFNTARDSSVTLNVEDFESFALQSGQRAIDTGVFTATEINSPPSENPDGPVPFSEDVAIVNLADAGFNLGPESSSGFSGRALSYGDERFSELRLDAFAKGTTQLSFNVAVRGSGEEIGLNIFDANGTNLSNGTISIDSSNGAFFGAISDAGDIGPLFLQIAGPGSDQVVNQGAVYSLAIDNLQFNSTASDSTPDGTGTTGGRQGAGTGGLLDPDTREAASNSMNPTPDSVGNDVPSPVPLPAGLPLILTAFGALAFVRRRA